VSKMVPFERALVSFYRLSIVSFPLSLRVLEILPLSFSIMPLFPYPTSSLPKFPHVPLGVGGLPSGYKKQRCWANLRNRLPVGGGCVYVLQMFFFAFFLFFLFFSLHHNYETTVLGNG